VSYVDVSVRILDTALRAMASSEGPSPFGRVLEGSDSGKCTLAGHQSGHGGLVPMPPGLVSEMVSRRSHRR